MVFRMPDRERFDVDWRPALLFEPSGSRLKCTLCPIGCALADGQAGACKVRRRSGDGGETATFATSVRHRDVIERKPFYHFRPGSETLTVAAPGCSFRCDYCINFRLSQFGRDEQAEWHAEPVDAGELAREAAAAGAAVAFSYTEPSLALELTLAVAEAGAPLGVDVVWKSNGFLTAGAVRLAAPVLAAVNIDVKGSDDARHRELTGAPVRPVFAALGLFRELGVWAEVSTPLIPGVSSAPADLAAIAREIAAVDPDLPWHLLRYTPTYRRSGDRPTTPEALAEAVEIGRDAGLKHVYVERALGEAGPATSCPSCGTTVVERAVWGAVRSHLSGGACPTCGTSVAGRWETAEHRETVRGR